MNYQEFFISETLQNKFKDKDFLKEEIRLGKTAQAIAGLPDEVMGKFYQAAYRLFENKKNEEASKAFLFLVSLNPYIHDYWLGFGMAQQLCHHYEEAIDAYEMAAICEIDNPVPYFYLAKCLFAIHDKKNALEALDLAIEYANDREEYTELKAQALIAKNLLQKKFETT